MTQTEARRSRGEVWVLASASTWPRLRTNTQLIGDRYWMADSSPTRLVFIRPWAKPGGYPWLGVREVLGTESRRGQDEVHSTDVLY